EARVEVGELRQRSFRPLVQGAELIDDLVVVVGVRVVVGNRLVPGRHHLPLREQPEQLPVDALEALVGIRRLGTRTEGREHNRVALDEPVAARGRGHEHVSRLDGATGLDSGTQGRLGPVRISADYLGDRFGAPGLLDRKTVQCQKLEIAGHAHEAIALSLRASATRSSGWGTIVVAPAARRSSSLDAPQRTPATATPACRPAVMSTGVSPTMRASAGEAPRRSSAASTARGSGFAAGASPSQMLTSISPSSCATRASAENRRRALEVTTAVFRPASRRSASASATPGNAWTSSPARVYASWKP